MTSSLSDLIARLREVEGKATKGPWRTDEHYPIYVWGPAHAMVADLPFDGDGEAYITRMRGVGRGATVVEQGNNAALITAARNALPVLLAVIEEQRRALEEISKGPSDSMGMVVVQKQAREALARVSELAKGVSE